MLHLPGRTCIVIRVTPSMTYGAAGLDMSRMDLACRYALELEKICERLYPYVFASINKRVDRKRTGKKLDKTLRKALVGHENRAGFAVRTALSRNQAIERVILITDGIPDDKLPYPAYWGGYRLNPGIERTLDYRGWLGITSNIRESLEFIAEDS